MFFRGIIAVLSREPAEIHKYTVWAERRLFFCLFVMLWQMVLKVLMWDIPVCGECKIGTINRQSHTK